MSATIRRVARPRGELTNDQRGYLRNARMQKEKWDAEYRHRVVLALMEGASFSAVAEFTGLSTNTLQRWKREASK